MKGIGILFFSLLTSCLLAQEKGSFSSLPNIVKNIIPNEKLDAWAVYYVEDVQQLPQELKKVGNITEDNMPSEGQGLHPYARKSFFYIATIKGGKKTYLTTVEDFKKFIGKVDNVQEAAVLAMLEGYFFDSEYKNYAANYWEDNLNYYVELGKITSTECPLQKNHFLITVAKGSHAVSEIKDMGKYMEMYLKSCKNNPRLLKLREEHQAEVEREAERNNPKKKKR